MFGVERNGEHGRVFDTQEEAEQYIVKQILFDHNRGWISKEAAEEKASQRYPALA